MIKRCKAERLPDHIAKHEWENRFKIMAIKRLGPSLVPAEVVIPLSKLGRVMAELEHTVKQSLVKEGIVIRSEASGEPEVVILGFIPSDQRKFRYNFVFGLSLSIMKIAEKHGGRAYSTGLYYSSKAQQVLGKTRVARIKAFKQKVDPKAILNPGKVINGGLLSKFMNLAGKFEPLIRPFGNHVITEIGERPNTTVRNIPGDVAWYAYACSQCGYCVGECDQFYGRGWESQSPRGKWYWLREFIEGREDWDQFMVDSILSCTTCELCNKRCSVSLPIESSWLKLRGQLIQDEKRMTFPPFEMMAAALHKEGDIWAGYRADRSKWFPQNLKEKHGPDHKAKLVYFAGCTASYVERDIGIASVMLLDAAGVDFTYTGEKESCCGMPMLVAGKWDLFAASRLGFEIPDPHPEVQRQWAVFEAMIALMTPEGFAQLMGAMLPELIDAMPFGMGHMMRAMGKIPGALNLMKPMFPVLFPRLLPKMMPQVMPTILKLVGESIPMPDYMREQMPELMPKVMDNLMPHMIKDVVPLVTQPMVDCLRGKKAG